MKGSISVPYKESNINGIFRKIARITKSKNIYRDGFISFYSSSIDAKTCFDVLTGTNEHSSAYSWVETLGDDSDPWITVDFHSLKLKIEGLVIHTGQIDFLPYYEVLVSNDNTTYEKVGDKTFNSQPATMTQSFTTTKKEARFIQLHGKGQRFGGENLRMAIYQMDLFGKLSGVSLFRQTCKERRKAQLLCLILCELIIAK